MARSKAKPKASVAKAGNDIQQKKVEEKKKLNKIFEEVDDDDEDDELGSDLSGDESMDEDDVDEFGSDDEDDDSSGDEGLALKPTKANGAKKMGLQKAPLGKLTPAAKTPAGKNLTPAQKKQTPQTKKGLVQNKKTPMKQKADEDDSDEDMSDDDDSAEEDEVSEEDSDEPPTPKKASVMTPLGKMPKTGGEKKQQQKRPNEDATSAQAKKQKTEKLSPEEWKAQRLENNKRSLFFGGFDKKATDAEIKELLPGEILEVKRVKTFAFLRFRDEASAKKSISLLKDKKLRGRGFFVDFVKDASEKTEKDYVKTRLHVSRLPRQVTEKQIQSVFPAAIRIRILGTRPHFKTGNAEPFAFLDFADEEAAAEAKESSVGQMIGGKLLQVLYAFKDPKEEARAQKAQQKNLARTDKDSPKQLKKPEATQQQIGKNKQQPTPQDKKKQQLTQMDRKKQMLGKKVAAPEDDDDDDADESEDDDSDDDVGLGSSNVVDDEDDDDDDDDEDDDDDDDDE